MAVRLRLKRFGRRHRPFYRLTAMDKRKARDSRAIEELAAEAISSVAGDNIDPLEVICYTYGQKSIRPASTEQMSGMLVVTDGLPEPFDQRSAFYRSIEGMRSDTLITVFAAVAYPTESARDHLRRALKEPLHAAIVEAVAGSSEKERSE